TFQFELGWDGFPIDGTNGVYVVGTFNSFELSDKMNKTGVKYDITVDFISIGNDTYYVGYKFRHITPDGWTDPEWYGDVYRSPEDLSTLYGLQTDNWEDWFILEINPTESPSKVL